jgi:hypothetical protein
MTDNKMQKVKWEKGSHIYTQWANQIVSKNNYVVCKMWYWLLEIDSGDKWYCFVGFQKDITIEMWHHFNDAFFALFFLGF